MATLTHQRFSTWRSRLRGDEFGTKSQLIAAFKQSRSAVGVMLTCWELSDAPDQISHATPGQMLIVQNPGGLIPPNGMDSGETIASVVFGLREFDAKHLIVCGHRDCLTVPQLLGDQNPDHLPEFREIVADVQNDLHDLDQRLSPRQCRDVAVQETVLQQLVHLRTYREIRSLLASGELVLHGWVYEDRTALIHAYDPNSGLFRL